ncbi:hypothetical protein CHRYSEOSP005_27690 [Chryseobacterium sp. Alg-005]|uniref:O-antigen ligase family protein n=1 Tax=Chryseobacterium sp. Alg-005 TaxID=3159516 RepID=UPI0035556BC2
MGKVIIHTRNTPTINLETFFLAFALFGYIICYIDPFSSDKLSQIINVLIRSSTFLLSIYFIIKNFNRVKERKNIIFFFISFYLLYLIKSEYTFYNYDFLPGVLEKLKKSFHYYMLVMPLPVVALLSFDYNKVNFSIFYKYVFWFLFVVLSLNFLYQILASRMVNAGRSGIFRSYYILTGHYGLSLVIMVIYSYLFLEVKKAQQIAGLFLGLFPIYVSAARSPVLALFCVFFVFLILKKNKKYWKVFFVSTFLFFILLLIAYLTGTDILFFKRLNAAVFEGNASGRSYYLNKGLAEIVNHPLIGGRTFFEDGSYPHNIFLDILMSTGIIGGFLFGAYYIHVIRNFFKIITNISQYKEAGILVFFFLQYFILAQTSGNAYSSFDFWYFSASLITLGYLNYNNEKIKSNDSRGNTTGDH